MIGTVVGRALAGSPVRDLRAGYRAGPNSIPKATSSQWSGYVDTNHTSKGTFRNIAASWNVPAIPGSACPSGNYGLRQAWVWAGLDGFGSNTVELAGTVSGCANGNLAYGAFYEMYPDAPVETFPADPGDHMSAYVDYTGSHWLLTIVDDTQDESYSTLLACPSGSTCDNYSAEAVAGAPGGCTASATQECNGSLYPLADFGHVTFSGISDATTNAGGSLGTSSFGPENLTAKAESDVLAKVTTTWANDGFVDSYKGTVTDVETR
jgi:Peptidase A4 family